MHITLRQIEVFLATARYGSITAAADMIAMSQSAASSALAELESQLGASLFDRIGRKVQLNENGLFILPQADHLIANASQIECSFNKYIPPRITIAASTTIGNFVMPGLLSEYTAAYADARVCLNIGNSHQVIDDVVNFRADIGFVEGISHDARVVADFWQKDEMAIYVAANHPFLQKMPSFAELSAAPWVLREPYSGSREMADSALIPLLGSLNVILELGSSDAINQVVKSGLAVSCQSRRVIEPLLLAGEVGEIKIAELNLHRHFYLVRHRDKSMTKGLLDFIEMSQHQITR